jgi:hypothetical protein
MDFKSHVFNHNAARDRESRPGVVVRMECIEIGCLLSTELLVPLPAIKGRKCYAAVATGSTSSI